MSDACEMPDHVKAAMITNDDGFVVFWPVANCGYYESHELRAIANYLDRINAPWQQVIDDYFEEHHMRGGSDDYLELLDGFNCIDKATTVWINGETVRSPALETPVYWRW